MTRDHTATEATCIRCGGTEDLMDRGMAPGMTYCRPCRVAIAENANEQPAQSTCYHDSIEHLRSDLRRSHFAWSDYADKRFEQDKMDPAFSPALMASAYALGLADVLQWVSDHVEDVEAVHALHDDIDGQLMNGGTLYPIDWHTVKRVALESNA